MPFFVRASGRSQFEAFRVADEDIVQQDGREIGEQGKESCERPSRPACFCSRLLLGPAVDGLAGSTGETRCARASGDGPRLPRRRDPP